MTDEERQIQNNLDYQTLIMLQQQQAEQEDFDDCQPHYQPGFTSWWDKDVEEGWMANLGWTNWGAWAFGNVVLELFIIFNWFLHPEMSKTSFCVLNISLMIGYNVGVCWLAKRKDDKQMLE
jgi:hypothetical protein